MRLFLSIIVLFSLNLSILSAQNALNQFRNAVEAQDYEKASSLIPQVIQENRKEVDVYLECGDLYMELMEYDKALELFQEADDLDGNEPHIMCRLGNALSILGRNEEAIEILKESLEEDDERYGTYIALGQAYIRDEQFAEAEVQIKAATNIDEDNPIGYMALGDIYFENGVFELARDYYLEALNKNENLLEARMKLATSLWRMGQRHLDYDYDLAQSLFSKSLMEWNKVTQMDPKNFKAFFQQGKILFYSERYKDAANSLLKYVELRPSGSLGRWFLAQSFYELQLCDSASTHLKRVAQEIDTVRNKARLMLARCYSSNKKWPQAIEAYNVAMQDTTLISDDYRKLGTSYFYTQDTTNALKYWNTSIDMDPSDNCSLLTNMIGVFYRAKNYDVVINSAQKLLAIEECMDTSTFANANFYLGMSYSLIDKPDSSLPYLKRSIELNPDYLYSSLYLADAYVALERIDTAEVIFKNIIEKAKEDTVKNKNVLLQAYSKMIRIYYEDRNWRKVSEIGEEFAEYYPEITQPYIFLGLAYHNLYSSALQAGKDGTYYKNKACKNYSMVLKLDPDNKAAKNNKAKICN